MNFKIYQLKKDFNKYLFLDYEYVKDEININMYNVVYDGEYHDKVHKNVNDQLDYIYTIFNINRPEGFNGHSLSISDIIELNGNFYYVDSFGFSKL